MKNLKEKIGETKKMNLLYERNLEKNEVKIRRKNQGITLVALVVTIVVLLILAGVTITTLFSDNGIINKAQDAANATNEAQKNTIIGLQQLEDELVRGLGEYTLTDIVESAKTLRALYENAESSGTSLTIGEENTGYFDLQDQIDNSKWKDKIVNLEGNLVYIGDDESEKKYVEEYGVDTTFASVINNIGAGNPEGMYFEKGFIRITPKWMNGADTSDRETSFKKLITNSEDENELNKITFEYLESQTSPYVYTGTKVYYEGKYIGTIVVNCDGDLNGTIDGIDLNMIRGSSNWNKSVRELNYKLYIIKAIDVYDDGIIDQKDYDILKGSDYWGHTTMI